MSKTLEFAVLIVAAVCVVAWEVLTLPLWLAKCTYDLVCED